MIFKIAFESYNKRRRINKFSIRNRKRKENEKATSPKCPAGRTTLLARLRGKLKSPQRAFHIRFLGKETAVHLSFHALCKGAIVFSEQLVTKHSSSVKPCYT
jgi:hypothetical protein